MKSFVMMVVCVVSVLVLLSASAFGATGPFTGTVPSGSLSNYWNLGDINGGYDTTMDHEYTQLSAYLGGTHKIQSSSISLYPDYNYVWDNNGNVLSKNILGYVVSAHFSGNLDANLMDQDIGSRSQQNRFNARGINTNQSSYLNVYKSYGKYDELGNGYGEHDLICNSGANMSLQNFQVTWADGNYSEYKGNYDIPEMEPTTWFNYNVTWHGKFSSEKPIFGFSTLGLSAPSIGVTVSVVPVPEPGTWALLLTSGLVGLGLCIKRRMW